jgi:hypothetical protein
MSSPLRSELLLFLPSLVLLWAVLSPLEAGAQRPACSLEAGLWLAPHGQSNDGVARASGAFLRKPDGTSASSTWEGTWLVDPTRPEAHTYLRDLFGRLTGWGYSYFKIDGQPIVIGEYEVRQEFMAAPPPAEEPRSNERLYRETLTTIRSAIGEQTYLLGCWGIPLAGAGIMNGSRTAGDIVQGWDGFLVAADAVHDWNYLHNVVWYADPDVLLVRPPLSEGTARAWATIQGLSGQALMASDNMPDLPASRVELLRRVYPAADVRPLDLFPPEGSRKPLWDLKVAHLGRAYDVVGVFNWSELQPVTRLVRWADLGLDEAGVYHVWDFWGGTYLGAWEDGVFVEVPAADVRVLTLVPHSGRPVLLSTSRHLTQGWVDLRELSGGGTATGPTERPVLSGRSRIIGDDPYTLVFGLPRSAPTYRIAEVRVHAPDDVPAPAMRHTSHQGYATLTLTLPVTAEVDWEVTFEPADLYHFPVQAPGAPQVLAEGITGAVLYWPTQYHVKAGYRVELDGRPLGVAFSPTAALRDLEPGRTYKVGIRSVWYDGSASPGAGEREFTPELPVLLHLADLEPLSARQGWGSLQRDRSVDRNPLKVGGETAERGLGTHSESEVRYRVFGRFRKFLARVGVDDEVRPPRPVELVFEVWGDGRRLWRSPVMRSGEPAVPVEVEIRGVQELLLKVLPGSDGIDYDHADWLEARVIR